MQTVVTIIPRRSEVIRAHKSRGGRVAAVLPIHYPRALFRAFDILPVEVWGPPNVDSTLGAAHLQPYVCSIARNALAFLLSGGLDETDFIVVPHACDSLQGFASILIDFIHPRQPVLPIYLPRGDRATHLQFLTDEFRALYRQLAAITSRTPSDADLMTCIAREEDADALLADLHARLRVGANGSLPLREMYRVIRSREYLSAETFLSLRGAQFATKQSPSELGIPFDYTQGMASQSSLAMTSEQSRPDGGIPIILSGIVPEPMGIFDAIEKMGGIVVADDFACCGRRLYPRGTSSAPFTRMAERIINAPADSTRDVPIRARLDHLTRLAHASGAKGIVFYDVKFCEPELFYLPALRHGLQDAGIQSIAIEVDLNDQLPQQALTRLEAFLEMVSRL